MESYEKYRKKNDPLYLIGAAQNIDDFMRARRRLDGEDSSVSVVFYKKAAELKNLRNEDQQSSSESVSSSESSQ